MRLSVNGTTIKSLKMVGGVLCGAVVLWSLWIAVRWNWSPSIRLSRDGSRITVDVSTLGEYPTTVKHIRLSDQNSGAVLWELRAATSEAQIRRLILSEGANPTKITATYGSYMVVAPSSSATFTLNKSSEYKLELWCGSSAITKSTTTFRFG
jgi:hypothetical protein